MLILMLYPHADAHAVAHADELAARLEAGEVVSLGGKVLMILAGRQDDNATLIPW